MLNRLVFIGFGFYEHPMAVRSDVAAIIFLHFLQKKSHKSLQVSKK